MSENRRREPRIETVMAGRIYLPERPAVPCRIVDFNETGAKVEMPAPIIDRSFLMLIEGLGQVWSATVRWRRGNNVGVEFERGIADLPAHPSGESADIFALKAQTAQIAISKLPRRRAKS